MRVLGIDPGIARTGYGIIAEKNQNFRHITSGCIYSHKSMAVEDRLENIFSKVTKLVEDYEPQALVIEKLFFSKNTRTALQVGEARGTVTLVAAKSNVPLFEYTPLQVKQAVAGYGKANKGQVQRMVCMLLKLAREPAVDDEADALAVAICHLHHHRWLNAVERGERK